MRRRGWELIAVALAWGLVVGSGMLSGWASFTEFSPVVMPSAVRFVLMFVAGLSFPCFAQGLDRLARAIVLFTLIAIAVPVLATTVSVYVLGNADVLGILVLGALRTGLIYSVPLIILSVAGTVVGAVIGSYGL